MLPKTVFAAALESENVGVVVGFATVNNGVRPETEVTVPDPPPPPHTPQIEAVPVESKHCPFVPYVPLIL